MTFTYVNSTSATVSLNLGGLPSTALEYGIATNAPSANGACTPLTALFNPFSADEEACSGSADPSDCPVGDLSTRHGTISSATSFPLSYTDTNIPVAGTNTIANRGIGLFFANGTVFDCAKLLFQCATCSASEYNPCDASQGASGNDTCVSLSPACTASQYQAAAPTSTSDRVCLAISSCTNAQYQAAPPTASSNRVCNNIATCDPYSQFQLAAPTTTSNRICQAYYTNQTVVLNFPNRTAAQVSASHATLTTNIQSLGLPSVVLLRIVDFTPSARRRTTASAGANVTFVSINATTLIPLHASEILTVLSTAASATSGCTLGSYSNCLDATLDVSGVSFAVAPQTVIVPDLPQNTTDTAKSYSAGTLAAMQTLAHMWINLIQPKDFPLSFVNTQIQRNRAGEGMDTSETQSTAVTYFMPMLCMAGFAFLMALLVPLVMFFVCCCRTCRCCCCFRRCGGERLQKSSQRNCRGFLMIFSLVLILIAVLASVGLLQGDQQITYGKNQFEETCYTSLDSIVDFKNLTIQQITAIVQEQLPAMESNLLLMVDQIASQRILLLPSLLANSTAKATDLMDDLSTSITSNLQNVQTIQTITGSAQTSLQTLSNTFSSFTSDSTTAKSDCLTIESSVSGGNQAAFDFLCQQYVTTAISIGVDYSSLPDLSSYSSALQSLENANLTEQIQVWVKRIESERQ